MHISTRTSIIFLWNLQRVTTVPAVSDYLLLLSCNNQSILTEENHPPAHPYAPQSAGQH